MDLQQAIKTNLHYYKQVKAKLDAHQTKATLNTLRKEWLDKQKVNNYQNEYDRITSIVANSVVAHHKPSKDRLDILEKLGVKLFDNPEIKKK